MNSLTRISITCRPSSRFSPSPFRKNVRAGIVWEHFQEVVAIAYGHTDIATIEPLHDQLRAMFLLRRSVSPPREYPMAMKEGRGVGYSGIQKVMLESYQVSGTQRKSDLIRKTRAWQT